MVYKKVSEGAKVGLEKKLQSYADNQIGQQIGACVNKAVDLTIALDSQKDVKMSSVEIVEQIKDWVDILYLIGTEKKNQILKDQKPKPLTKEQVEEAQKQGERILEVENQEQGAGIDAVNDELNKEAFGLTENKEPQEPPF